MIITKLFDHLEPHLIEAKEIWIAVALLNDRALEKVLESVPAESKQHYLIGIHLPTSPSALEKLMTMKSSKLDAVYHANRQTFHPKLYLIRKQSEYIAFLGSANATMGGFCSNIELSFLVTEQNICLELKNWFERMYQNGREITEEFLTLYKRAFDKNRKLRSIQESNLNAVVDNVNFPLKTVIINDGQFFNESHFHAYEQKFHTDASDLADSQRSKIRDRFLELHDLIYPNFNAFGISDLHTPANRRNYTSQYFHSRGILNKKDAIWLNYGKSEVQLSKSHDKKFVNNNRIQIILRNNGNEKFIGIWLFLGKPNKSREDREYLKSKIANPDFLELLHTLFMDLGDSYWIRSKEVYYPISELGEKSKLYQVLDSDNFRDYYTVGRNYDPNNDCLSIANIANTVLIEFAKLFRIYNMVRKP